MHVLCRIAFSVAMASVAADVEAQKSPACQAVFASAQKVITTEHLATADMGDGKTSQAIMAGGVNYVNVRGKWQRSPMSPQEHLQLEKENIQNAKVYTCEREADAVVDGVPVTVWRVHSETEDTVADGKMSIGKSTGLPVTMDEDIKVGPGTIRHVSTHYSYDAIRAPM